MLPTYNSKHTVPPYEHLKSVCCLTDDAFFSALASFVTFLICGAKINQIASHILSKIQVT